MSHQFLCKGREIFHPQKDFYLDNHVESVAPLLVQDVAGSNDKASHVGVLQDVVVLQRQVRVANNSLKQARLTQVLVFFSHSVQR